MTQTQDGIKVSGIWLRTIGNKVEVLAEVDGQWRKVIDETYAGPSEDVISHIVEPSGIKNSRVAVF